MPDCPAQLPQTPDPTHPSPWLLGPRDLQRIHADRHLIELLAAGEQLDESNPAARALAAWMAEVTR